VGVLNPYIISKFDPIVTSRVAIRSPSGVRSRRNSRAGAGGKTFRASVKTSCRCWNVKRSEAATNRATTPHVARRDFAVAKKSTAPMPSVTKSSALQEPA
jgi:hypothetical protein